MPKLKDLVPEETVKKLEQDHRYNGEVKTSVVKVEQRILWAIEQHSGISATGVGKVLNIEAPYRELYVLAKEGKVKKRRMDGLLRYYPISYVFADEIKGKENDMQVQASLIPRSVEITQCVNEHPGVTAAQVAVLLSHIPLGTVHGTISVLNKKGVLKRDSESRLYLASYNLPEVTARGRYDLTKKIFEFITENPGVSTAQVIAEIQSAFPGTEKKTVVRRVTKLITKRRLVRDEHSNLFLPGAAVATAEVVQEVVETQRPLELVETKQEELSNDALVTLVETIAKEYVWHTGQHREALQDVLTWYKDQSNG